VSRRGIVHVIDALVAIAIISAVIVAGASVILSKVSTRPQTMPDTGMIDEYVRARLESGEWLPLVAEMRADIIRQQILVLFEDAPRPVYIAVYIYTVSPSTGEISVYASSDPGLQGTYKTLRYFVPASGYYGDVALILEVRVYWG